MFLEYIYSIFNYFQEWNTKKLNLWLAAAEGAGQVDFCNW